jgi:hypothetical protein
VEIDIYTVRLRWQSIFDKVDSGEMPPDKPEENPCPEGGWDELTRNQFKKDFEAWKAGNFEE